MFYFYFILLFYFFIFLFYYLVCLDVLQPRLNKLRQRRLVVGDSYFASVATVEALAKKNINFIRVIKTARKRFPKTHLQTIEFNKRGDQTHLVFLDSINIVNMVALAWVDCEWRYFVGNAKGVMDAEPIFCKRWCQVSEDPFHNAEMVELKINQPRMAETYYTATGEIDCHNCQRQQDFEIEKYIRTHDWSKRVNLSVLGIICVDAMNVHQACAHFINIDPSPHNWICGLAGKMIKNKFDITQQITQRRKQKEGEAFSTVPPAQIKSHLCKDDGHTLQRTCRVCSKKCTHICDVCSASDTGELLDTQTYVCSASTARDCWHWNLNKKTEESCVLLPQINIEYCFLYYYFIT